MQNTTEINRCEYSNTIFVLLDFDNFFDVDIATEEFLWLGDFLNKVCSHLQTISPNTKEVIIRIYGGWMQMGVYTNFASKLSTKISSIDFFPVYNRATKLHIGGKIELVTRLLSIPDIEWDNTVRTWPGLPRIRLSKINGGASCDNDLCPAKVLHRFCKSRKKKCQVESCAKTNEELFQVTEQKMVDSMIACDFIFLTKFNPLCTVVMSDDFDILPPLAMSLSTQNGFLNVQLIRKNTRYHYPEVLNLVHRGLTIKTWEST